MSEAASQTFERRTELPFPAEEVYAWHARPGALDRLIPPWERVDILQRGQGIEDGSEVVLLNHLGPLKLRWVAEHLDGQVGTQFRDIQRRGPFKRWEHTHRFLPQTATTSMLEDHVEYQLPGGSLGRVLAGGFVESKIQQMFAYRHQTTEADLAAHARFRQRAPLSLGITGSQGMIGSALVPLLTTGGHGVTRVVRREAKPGEIRWDPTAGGLGVSDLQGLDGIVHLAGENIAAGHWSDRRKQQIRESRVNGTRLLCEAIAKMDSPPKVLVSASAIGYYGDRGEELLDEGSRAGDGFLAQVAQEWEAATKPAVEAGVRVVLLRLGVVLSPKSGALAKMLTPFKVGAGGRIGGGRQYWSWIALDDAAGAIHHALLSEELRGAVNAVAPEPVTNAEFTKVLARVLRRPAVVPLPAAAARLALGELADELLLASLRVAPRQLEMSNYQFRHSQLEKALRSMLGKQHGLTAGGH